MPNIETKWMKLAGLAAATGIAAMLALPVAAQAGETPEKGRYVNLKADTDCAKVADVEGHVICSYEIPAVQISDQGEAGSRVVLGTLDYVNGVGKNQGYTVTTYADGSTRAVWWEGDSKFNDQKVRYAEGTYACVGGSGRLAGIKCEGKWKTTFEKGGFGSGTYEGTMTLPD